MKTRDMRRKATGVRYLLLLIRMFTRRAVCTDERINTPRAGRLDHRKTARNPSTALNQLTGSADTFHGCFLRERQQENDDAMGRLPMNTSRKLNKPMQISCDDVKHLILVNGWRVSLTPTQYQIFRAFISEKGGGYNTKHNLRVVSFVTKKCLLYSVHISEVALRKQMSNLNSRLRPYGIQIGTLRDGYVLVLDEQTRDQA